jgi:ABC-type lipoprotein release transport system permease subunit
VILGALLISVVSAYVPAQRSAQITPIETIRNN